MKLSDVDISRLRTLHGAAQKAAHAVDVEARKARAKGATWTELGYALGISAQAAQKRYGDGQERSEAHREAAAAKAVKRARKTTTRRAN